MTTTSPNRTVDPVSPRTRGSGIQRWQRAVGILGLVVVFWVGNRLYDVIDRGRAGPGATQQHGGAPASQPTGTDPSDPAQGPSGGGDHDPSRFNH